MYIHAIFICIFYPENAATQRWWLEIPTAVKVQDLKPANWTQAMVQARRKDLRPPAFL